jgi:hypothetical protein
MTTVPGTEAVELTISDVRHAFRQLLKVPTFTAGAMLILAWSDYGHVLHH